MVSSSTSRPFPGFGALYKLSEPGEVRYFRATLDLDEDPFKVTRGEIEPAQPVRAQWVMGAREPVDVVRTDDVAPVLVSNRIVKLLQESGFSGWSTYEVDLHSRNDEPISRYGGLVVHGRCGPIDNSKSVQVPKQFPARVSMMWKGLYFDSTTWDGSDFFMPKGEGGRIFVTAAVRRALQKAKVENVVFTPLDEVERRVLL